MFRSILAVIVGFVVMAVVVLTTSTVALVALGPDRVVDPVTDQVTPLWLATNFASGLLAAVIGGAVAVLIGGAKPAKVLAFVVLGLGLVEAIVGLFVPTGPPAIDTARDPDQPPTIVERMRDAEQPKWYPFVIPVVGAVGVMVGASLVGSLRGRGDGDR